jgi:hypothetical protein
VERNVFPDPAVQSELKKFVCVELYLDRSSTADLAAKSSRYRDYQVRKFNTAARPYYAVVEADGETIVAAYPTSTDAAPGKASILALLKAGEQ